MGSVRAVGQWGQSGLELVTRPKWGGECTESMLCRFCLTFWGNSTGLTVRINNYALDVIWGVQKVQTPPSLCLTDDFCNTCMRLCMLRCFSRVWLFAALWTVACRAPLSMGFSQARTLEQVAMPSSRGSSQPRDRIHISWVSCIGKWVLYHWATWEASLQYLIFPKLKLLFRLSGNQCILFKW